MERLTDVLICMRPSTVLWLGVAIAVFTLVNAIRFWESGGLKAWLMHMAGLVPYCVLLTLSFWMWQTVSIDSGLSILVLLGTLSVGLVGYCFHTLYTWLCRQETKYGTHQFGLKLLAMLPYIIILAAITSIGGYSFAQGATMTGTQVNAFVLSVIWLMIFVIDIAVSTFSYKYVVSLSDFFNRMKDDRDEYKKAKDEEDKRLAQEQQVEAKITQLTDRVWRLIESDPLLSPFDRQNLRQNLNLMVRNLSPEERDKPGVFAYLIKSYYRLYPRDRITAEQIDAAAGVAEEEVLNNRINLPERERQNLKPCLRETIVSMLAQKRPPALEDVPRLAASRYLEASQRLPQRPSPNGHVKHPSERLVQEAEHARNNLG